MRLRVVPAHVHLQVLSSHVSITTSFATLYLSVNVSESLMVLLVLLSASVDLFKAARRDKVY